MVDISMCTNQDCPSKDTCYRFTASPNVWRQSYMEFKPEVDSNQCKYYSLDNRTNEEKELDEKHYQEDLVEYNSKHPSTNTA